MLGHHPLSTFPLSTINFVASDDQPPQRCVCDDGSEETYNDPAIVGWFQDYYDTPPQQPLADFVSDELVIAAAQDNFGVELYEFDDFNYYTDWATGPPADADGGDTPAQPVFPDGSELTDGSEDWPDLSFISVMQDDADGGDTPARPLFPDASELTDGSEDWPDIYSFTVAGGIEDAPPSVDEYSFPVYPDASELTDRSEEWPDDLFSIINGPPDQDDEYLLGIYPDASELTDRGEEWIDDHLGFIQQGGLDDLPPPDTAITAPVLSLDDFSEPDNFEIYGGFILGPLQDAPVVVAPVSTLPQGVGAGWFAERQLKRPKKIAWPNLPVPENKPAPPWNGRVVQRSDAIASRRRIAMNLAAFKAKLQRDRELEDDAIVAIIASILASEGDDE